MNPDDLRTAEPQPDAVPWRAREGIGLFVVSFVAMMIVMVGIVLGVHSKDIQGVIAIALQESALLVIVLVWIRTHYDAGPERLWLREFTPQNLAVGVGVGIVGLFVVFLTAGAAAWALEHIANTTVKAPEQLTFEAAKPGVGILALAGLGVVVLAPLAEEVFWRGFILRGLRRSLSAIPAMVSSAVMFGLVHISAADTWEKAGQYVFTLAIPIGMLGYLFAVTAERRRSIVPTIVAHMVFNGINFAVLVSNGTFGRG